MSQYLSANDDFSETITMNFEHCVPKKCYLAMMSQYLPSGVCSYDKMTPLYLLRPSKVWSMLHQGLVWLVHKKMLLKLLCTFLTFFCCFSSQNLCFYHFHFFF